MTGNGRAYHLQLLGGLRLSGHAGMLADERRARLPLLVLAYSAMAGPDGPTRDELMAFFWPEHNAERASHNLSQALYALRHEVGASDVIRGRQRLAVESSRLSFDVETFRDAFRAGDWAGVLASYGGPFLDGVSSRGVAPLSHWVESTRERLARQFAEAEERLTITQLRDGHIDAVLDRWRERAHHDPLNARAVMHTAHALLAAGRRSDALAVLKRHISTVREDPQGTPARAVSELLTRLDSNHAQDGFAREHAASHHRVEELCAKARGLSNGFRSVAMREALLATEQAIALAPTSAAAWSTRAAVLAMWSGVRTDADWWREPQHALERALALEPGAIEPSLWLAQVLVRRSEFERAMRLAASVSEAPGAPYMAALFHGLTLVSTGTEQAVAILVEQGMERLTYALCQHPQSAPVLEPLCELAIVRGDLAHATEWAAQLRRIRDAGGSDVRFPAVDVQSGWLALAKNDAPGAIAIAEAALADPSLPDHGYGDLFAASAHLLAGDARRRMHEFDAALAEYRAAGEAVRPLLGAWGRQLLAERAARRRATTFSMLRMWSHAESEMAQFRHATSSLAARQTGWLPGSNLASLAVDRAIHAAARDDFHRCSEWVRDAARRGWRNAAVFAGDPAFVGALEDRGVQEALAEMHRARRDNG